MPDKRTRAGKLTLHPLKFGDAVSGLLKAKPAGKPKKVKSRSVKGEKQAELEESEAESEDSIKGLAN